MAGHRRIASKGAVVETRQVESKRTTFGQNDRPLNYILQLAHVAGPIVALQFLHVQLGQARTRNSEAAEGLLDKVLGKSPNIFEALAQGRDFDWEYAEAIIQVETKPASLGLNEKFA